MPGVIQALDFLGRVKLEVPAVCVLFGDELFLRKESLARLRQAVLGDADGEFSLTTFDGEDATLDGVLDCLSTVALFGTGRRLVIVRQADDFVSRNRAALESYVARPKSSGVLVLEVKSWPSNTKLAKAVATNGLTVECKTPPPASILKWLDERAKSVHQARLERSSAELLLDSIEPDLGLLDQELAKLALAAGIDGTIEPQLVRELVGGWRTKTTWDMLDRAAEGNAAQAIRQLDRLLASGEQPIPVLAQVGSRLRKFAAAARIAERANRTGRRLTLKAALEAAGTNPYVANQVESQLRQLGPDRGARLCRWVLDADLALKGQSSSSVRARAVLERLIVRMSSKAAK